MKNFSKLLLLSLLLSVASLYFLQRPDGTALADLDSLLTRLNLSALLDTTATPSNKPPVAVVESQPDEVVNDENPLPEFYRWQDDQGTVHFSNIPPAGIEAQAVELTPPTVMNLTRSAPAGPEPSQKLGPDNSRDALNTTLSVKNETAAETDVLTDIQKIQRDAERVTEELQDKLQEQKQILDEL